MSPTIHTWIHGSFLEHKSLQSEVLYLIDFDHTQVQLSVILLISTTHETAIIYLINFDHPSTAIVYVICWILTTHVTAISYLIDFDHTCNSY